MEVITQEIDSDNAPSGSKLEGEKKKKKKREQKNRQNCPESLFQTSSLWLTQLRIRRAGVRHFVSCFRQCKTVFLP